MNTNLKVCMKSPISIQFAWEQNQFLFKPKSYRRDKRLSKGKILKVITKIDIHIRFFKNFLV